MQVMEYVEAEVRDLLLRPATESPWCTAMGGVEHTIPIRFHVEVNGGTHLIEAHVFVEECGACGACPVDEQSVLHTCLTYYTDNGEDFSHDTNGLEILRRHLG